jgi:hypothetical protein
MSAWSRLAAVALALGALTGLAAGRAAADVLYSQPSTFRDGNTPTSAGGVGIYFSQNDTEFPGSPYQPPTPPPGDLYQLAYDNFKLSRTANITSVQWQGGYAFGPQGTITAFHLTFWPDTVIGNVHQPNTSANPLRLTIQGNANESPAGTETGSSGSSNLIFNYSANLPTSFTAQAGTQYWLSIFPDLDSSVAGNWGWHTGSGGDGMSVLDTFDPAVGTPGRTFTNNDLTFSLLGSAAAVPEPSTLALLGLGCAALVVRFRRKGRVSGLLPRTASGRRSP